MSSASLSHPVHTPISWPVLPVVVLKTILFKLAVLASCVFSVPALLFASCTADNASVGSGQALVMDAGSTSVLLSHAFANMRTEIEVWDTARDATASFLEALPAKLHRRYAFGN